MEIEKTLSQMLQGRLLADDANIPVMVLARSISSAIKKGTLT